MDLDFAAPPALLVLCTVAAGGFAWWSYRRSVPRPAGWRFPTLVALRTAALALVLFLLFEPVWTRAVARGDAALVAVLVDESESLTLGPGVAARVRAALAGLPADAALRFYTFAGDATLRGTRLAADSLAFRGERTDLARALARVEADFAGRSLRAVVLVSDGRSTDGRDPAAVAERLGVPVYAAVAGDSLSSRDVRLSRLVANEVGTVGSPLPVQAGVRATGFGGRPARVTIAEGGRVIGTAAVVLPADGGEATVDLAVTPATPGLKAYTVTAVPLPGEATTRNNRQSVTVRVGSDKRRVLVLAAAPSPDLAALRAVLDADRSVEATVRTQRGPGAYYEGPLPEPLGRFDLLVLAGFPGAAASDADVARVAAAVRGGTPALFLMGRQTSLARVAAGLGDVLPASPAGAGGFADGAFAPTAAGEVHPVLAAPGVPASRLTALPPLAVSTARWALQPGAVALATARGAPLLVVRQSGNVRTAALLGAGTWRWRTLPDGLADLAPVYPALLDRLVRWSTAPRDRRPVRVRPDRALFGEREPVTFTGQVYTAELAPVADADVRITVRGPRGAAAVPMRALGAGRYAADAGSLPPGAYTFVAEASRGGAGLGSDRGTFGVGRLSAEFREPGADVATMRRIALRSGGALVGLDTLGAFVRSLRTRGALADAPFARRDATPVLGLPWLLGAILVLLTAEWIVRKRGGMV